MREELTLHVPEKPPKRRGADLMQVAARASWVAPVIAFVVGMSVRSIAPTSAAPWLATRVACGLVMLFGVGSGGIALIGVKRRGPEDLVVPAGIGLAVSILVMVTWLLLPARPME